jgi:lipopolysaccharide transport system permease protein
VTPARAAWPQVLAALTLADLRVRYGRGPGRLVKWLLDPFALVGVLLILVTVLLDRPGAAPGLSLACAVVPFQLIVMTVLNAMGAVVARRSILLNLDFDRVLIPLSSACTEFAAFGASAVLLAGMMAVYGVGPTLALLWLPAVLAVTAAFAVGCAYAAALFGLWFPELRSLGLSMVRALFFLAPGIVAIEDIPSPADDWVKLNPLSGLFEAFRSVVLDGAAPAAWSLLVPLGAAALLLALAFPVFRRDQAHFAKVLG